MKYSESNKPLVCMMTQSTCYKGTTKMAPKGVLWHSTGANNPTLKRYVQPDDDAPNREEMITLIGKNQYNNDWNHIERQAGLNAWIGKLADGTVTSIQTMPWDYKPWGCGAGSKGSCNNGWMQFEICEDGLTDKEYFDAVYKEACELTAYYCKMYNLDPKGTVTYNGVTVPVILCHQDSYKLKLGGNHSDVYPWFNKHGKTMDDVRNDVAELLKQVVVEKEPEKEKEEVSAFKEGDIVKLADDALYYSGKAVPLWVKAKEWIVKSVKGDRVVIDKSVDGANSINSPVNVKYLQLVQIEEPKPEAKPEPEVFVPYLVKINTGLLNYRQGPGTNYKINGTVKKGGVYTIVGEDNGWGKLKSGAGWIKLSYTVKL